MGYFKGGVVMAQKTEDMSKEDRIQAEFKSLRKNLLAMAPAVKKINESLIYRAAFMRITLEDLEATINRDGPVCEYQNGENQWGTKKSPEIDIYNNMSKNYAAVIKQLISSIPNTEDRPKIDEFDKFVSGR
jgi:hypothetical protein